MSEFQEKVVKLIEEYRARCLWFLREDYVPVTPEEIAQTLELIERYGDRDSYLRAEELKQWLLRDSSAMSSSC